MTKTLNIFVALVLLAGCERVNVTPAAEVSVKTYETGMGYRVREFNLEDGTRCVVVVDTGITCDWGHR
jgi:ferric-dicitrate binding protein FerR (iron transport regulator)